MSPQVDDILKELEQSKVKKKIKSGTKGKGAEREIVKILKRKRFWEIKTEKLLSQHEDWGKFSRSVGSGNRWGQGVDLPKHAQGHIFSGDLCVPQNFLWVLESKKGYNEEIDLCTLFGGTNATLDSFLKQVEDDSARCNRKPMLIWKKDYKPRLAFMHNQDAPLPGIFTCALSYKGWLAVPFEELMKQDDSFFFAL